MSRLKLPIVCIAALVMLGAVSTSAFAQKTPTAAEAAAYKNRPCADPWINLATLAALGELPKGSGVTDDCAPKAYDANGNWGSYQDLVAKVRAFHQTFASEGLAVSTANGVIALVVSSPSVAKSVLGLTAADGKSLLSPNYVIAAGGGNVIAAGGGNVIAAGGGNYTVQSVGGPMKIKLPGGRVAIVKR